MGGALYQKNNSSYYQKQYCLKHISNFHSITAFTKRSIQTSENKKHQEKVVSTLKVEKKKRKKSCYNQCAITQIGQYYLRKFTI